VEQEARNLPRTARYLARRPISGSANLDRPEPRVRRINAPKKAVRYFAPEGIGSIEMSTSHWFAQDNVKNSSDEQALVKPQKISRGSAPDFKICLLALRMLW
jgi:hypothetical protein